MIVDARCVYSKSMFGQYHNLVITYSLSLPIACFALQTRTHLYALLLIQNKTLSCYISSFSSLCISSFSN